MLFASPKQWSVILNNAMVYNVLMCNVEKCVYNAAIFG